MVLVIQTQPIGNKFAGLTANAVIISILIICESVFLGVGGCMSLTGCLSGDSTASSAFPRALLNTTCRILISPRHTAGQPASLCRRDTCMTIWQTCEVPTLSRQSTEEPLSYPEDGVAACA